MKKVTVLLIVDDDPDDREMLEMQLKKIDNSFLIFTATDGEDAFTTLQEKMVLEPNIIFLDLNMPGMDGRLFLKELKKNNRFRHVPVIIYSTSNTSSDREETAKLGASFYLSKPDDPRELRKSLPTILTSFLSSI